MRRKCIAVLLVVISLAAPTVFARAEYFAAGTSAAAM